MWGHHGILKNTVLCVNKTIDTHLFIISKGVPNSSLHVYKDGKVEAKKQMQADPAQYLRIINIEKMVRKCALP